MKANTNNKVSTNKHFLAQMLILFSILVSIDFYSYIYRPELNYLRYILFIIYLAIMISTRRVYKRDCLDKIVFWTVITIFLSIIPAMLDYNQGFFLTLKACVSFGFSWFVYFALKDLKASSSGVIKIVTSVSVLWVIFEIGQQFTYPNIWFSGRYTISGQVEERMGILRFYIFGVDFVMMAFAYWLGNIESKNKSKIRTIVLVGTFLLGLLAYGSRKHIVVVLGAIAFFGLFSSVGDKRKKRLVMLFVALFFVIIYYNFYADWVEMNEVANSYQGEGDNFIRLMSAQHYLFEFSDSKLYPIFGAGIRVQGSLLDKKLQSSENYFGDMFGFWQADVGLIGYYSMVGILGVSAILFFIFYFVYNWKFIDTWYKYFLGMKIALIIFDFWGIWAPGMMAFALFMYLLDCNIRKNKQKALINGINVTVR